MSKTITLRTELQRLLKTVTPRVLNEDTPDPPPYPYLVYELSELYSEYGKTLMELEVNLLDYGSSSTAIEILADTLQYTLNRYVFINTEIQFRLYKGLRQKVEEEDKQIIRRRLLFELHLHEMKGE